MNIIVAVDENFGIGFENGMLYDLKGDMKFFKEKTSESVVIMGRNTLLSLPNSSPLKGRVNIVMTSKEHIEGCICCNSVEHLFVLLKDYADKKIFVIGGEAIYKTLLPYCEKAYITKIFAKTDADRFFPNIDELSNWQIAEQSEEFCENGIQYQFLIYVNINPIKNNEGISFTY